jgi:hypothetical protein
VGVLGHGPTSPLPNPQSPIPNPHYILYIFKIMKKDIEFENKNNLKFNLISI